MKKTMLADEVKAFQDSFIPNISGRVFDTLMFELHGVIVACIAASFLHLI